MSIPITPHPRQPDIPTPSATLILIRQNKAVGQVCLLRRSSSSAFMPGTHVFPGGELEDGDRDYECEKIVVDTGRLEKDGLTALKPF